MRSVIDIKELSVTEIDELVASLKLASMGKTIDVLTDEQYEYLHS